MLQQRGHPDAPPALLSDGWGGIDDAMLAVYGIVPQYIADGVVHLRDPNPEKTGAICKWSNSVMNMDAFKV